MPHPISPTAFVRHDPLTGRAYVHLPPIMAGGMASLGYDAEYYAAQYEANLRASALWPADLPPVVMPRPRRRRRWKVVIGRRRA